MLKNRFSAEQPASSRPVPTPKRPALTASRRWRCAPALQLPKRWRAWSQWTACSRKGCAPEWFGFTLHAMQ